MPPRGPRSVLCVVVVTKSATPTGCGIDAGRDQARVVRHVRPSDSAPTSSAIARKRAQSITREYAEAPATISFGLCSMREPLGLLVVDQLVVGSRP